MRSLKFNQIDVLNGVNLKAPGDRMSKDGILWLDFPSIGGPSPDIPVSLTADNATYIRRHSSFLPNCRTLPWVSASAIAGLQSIEITLSKELMRLIQSDYILWSSNPRLPEGEYSMSRYKGNQCLRILIL